MRFQHGDNVTLVNDVPGPAGATIPSGTAGVVLSGKTVGGTDLYSVSFPGFGLDIVADSDLA